MQIHFPDLTDRHTFAYATTITDDDSYDDFGAVPHTGSKGAAQTKGFGFANRQYHIEK